MQLEAMIKLICYLLKYLRLCITEATSTYSDECPKIIQKIRLDTYVNEAMLEILITIKISEHLFGGFYGR